MSPYEVVATALKVIIDSEFAAEQIVAVHDNLHDSRGRDSIDVGIAPMRETLLRGNDVVQETWVEIKFFDLYPQEISPYTEVNPFRITGFAHRFRNAVRRAKATDPGTNLVWYFDLRDIAYPNDPTGNKTRFVATVRAFGENVGLVETSG